MEPRTLSFDSKCKNFCEIYNSGRDVYRELAAGYLKLKNSHAGGDPNYEPTPDEVKEKRPWFKQLSLALL